VKHAEDTNANFKYVDRTALQLHIPYTHSMVQDIL